MKEIGVGTKIYSYCYGPMTVIRTDERYLYATMDDVAGASAKMQIYDALTPEHCFYRNAIGHWIFLSAGEIGGENDVFSHMCQPSNHLTVSPDMVHSFFQGRLKSATAVKGKPNSITVVNDTASTDSSHHTRLNPVAVVDETASVPSRKNALNEVTVIG